MSIPEITQIVSEAGMGTVSFVALLYGGFRILRWMEVAQDTLNKIKDNHLEHIQGSMKMLVENSTCANEMLKDQGRSLDAQSQMLGLIVEQQRKQ